MLDVERWIRAHKMVRAIEGAFSAQRRSYLEAQLLTRLRRFRSSTAGGGEAAADLRALEARAREDEIEEFEEFVGDFSGPRTQEIFTKRRSLRCNNKLEASLPRLVNFQGSDAVCRRLAFV